MLALYDESYYGKGKRKFGGGIEQAIALLTWRKWKRLRRLAGPAGALLDVGCGRGTLVRLARAQGCEAYGVERPYPGAPFLPHVFYRDLADSRFPSDHFQVVTLWHVLEHLPDPAETLREIHRVLRPGGWLSLAVPNYGGAVARASREHWFHLDLPRHMWHFDSGSLRALLQRHGFEIRRSGTLSLEYDWFGVLQSWMNAWMGDNNHLYAALKGQSRGAASIAAAAALAFPALAKTLWDAARARGGTLTVTAQKKSAPAC
jgi:SAM-dependent methyltransferase